MSLATDGEIVGIAAAPAGYVVMERQRTAWFSADGRTWTPIVLPFEPATVNGIELGAWVNAVVGGPGGFIAVGGRDARPCSEPHGAGGPPPCARKPISWASTDGVTWRRNTSPIPLDGSELPAYSQIVQAWPAGDGWDAAVEAVSSVVPNGNALLHTSDGRGWTVLPSPPLPDGASTGREVNAHAGVATAEGRRLVWQFVESSGSTSLATSPDGTKWTEIAGFHVVGADLRFGIAPEDGSESLWVLVGDTTISGEPVGLSWVSEDLVEWRTGQVADGMTGAGYVSALERWNGRYIVLGDGGTWTSPEGLTWSFVEPSEPGRPDLPSYLAAGPAGLFGVGFRDEVTTVWRWVDRET